MKENGYIRQCAVIFMTALLLAALLCLGFTVFADPEDETTEPESTTAVDSTDQIRNTDTEASSDTSDEPKTLPPVTTEAPASETSEDASAPVTETIPPVTDEPAVPITDVLTEPMPVTEITVDTDQTTKVTTTTTTTTWHIQINNPVSAAKPSLSPAVVPVTDAPPKDPDVTQNNAENTANDVTVLEATTAKVNTGTETTAVITTNGLITAGAILSFIALLAIVFTLLFNKSA